jgi:hypothetical protein
MEIYPRTGVERAMKLQKKRTFLLANDSTG